MSINIYEKMIGIELIKKNWFRLESFFAILLISPFLSLANEQGEEQECISVRSNKRKTEFEQSWVLHEVKNLMGFSVQTDFSNFYPFYKKSLQTLKENTQLNSSLLASLSPETCLEKYDTVIIGGGPSTANFIHPYGKAIMKNIGPSEALIISGSSLCHSCVFSKMDFAINSTNNFRNSRLSNRNPVASKKKWSLGKITPGQYPSSRFLGMLVTNSLGEAVENKYAQVLFETKVTDITQENDPENKSTFFKISIENSLFPNKTRCVKAKKIIDATGLGSPKKIKDSSSKIIKEHPHLLTGDSFLEALQNARLKKIDKIKRFPEYPNFRYLSGKEFKKESDQYEEDKERIEKEITVKSIIDALNLNDPFDNYLLSKNNKKNKKKGKASHYKGTKVTHKDYLSFFESIRIGVLGGGDGGRIVIEALLDKLQKYNQSIPYKNIFFLGLPQSQKKYRQSLLTKSREERYLSLTSYHILNREKMRNLLTFGSKRRKVQKVLPFVRRKIEVREGKWQVVKINSDKGEENNFLPEITLQRTDKKGKAQEITVDILINTTGYQREVNYLTSLIPDLSQQMSLKEAREKIENIKAPNVSLNSSGKTKASAVVARKIKNSHYYFIGPGASVLPGQQHITEENFGHQGSGKAPLPPHLQVSLEYNRGLIEAFAKMMANSKYKKEVKKGAPRH